MKKKKQIGYTLVEILAILLVVSTLVYLAVPTYDKIMFRSDVSDALYNMNLLSTAQNKYFISNGKYTSNLSSLETPLKGSTESITTKNFTYFAGKVSEGNYCIYSQHKKNGYILARNYKTNSDVLCSGTYCGKLDNVKTGSLTDLCGSSFNNDCDKTCTHPAILDEEECECTCDKDYCRKLTIQDPSSCNCSCVGQSIRDLDIPKYFQCVCPKSVEESCINQGLYYSEEKCDCADSLCNKEDSYCSGHGKINKEKCACECDNSLKECYHGNGTYDPENCSCTCSITEATCKKLGKVFDEDNCLCVVAGCDKECDNDTQILNTEKCVCDCNDERIKNCSQNSNQVLQADCSCSCKASLSCKDGQTYNPVTCACEGECDKDDSYCNSQSNGYLNPDTCQCVCNKSLKCKEKEVYNPETCACQDITCDKDNSYCNNNGTMNLLTCQCECDQSLKCKDGQVYNPLTCACEGKCKRDDGYCNSQDNGHINLSTCKCECDKSLKCKENETYNSEICACECNLQEGDCSKDQVLDKDECICKKKEKV